MVLLWQFEGVRRGCSFAVSRTCCPCLPVCAQTARIMRVSVCALTYPSTPRGDVAGSLVLQDGLHRHRCNLSLFVVLGRLCNCHARAPACMQTLLLRCLSLVAGTRCALAGA